MSKFERKSLLMNPLSYIGHIVENICDIKNTARLPFNVSEICNIFNQAQHVLSSEPSILQLTGKYIIVGDIHGSISSLLQIFQDCGDPSETKYIFLGDYVDRGTNSIEVLMILSSYKIIYPDHIYLLRGNHETPCMTFGYGYYKECISREAKQVYEASLHLFDELPIAAILNNQIFITHGGISSKIKSREDLFAVKKISFMKEIENQMNYEIVMDLLWSDPSQSISQFSKSPRGCAHIFGAEALEDFLKNIQCSLVVRSHEVCQNGYSFSLPNQKILTIFSACNYCGQMNDGAYLVSDVTSVQIKIFKTNEFNPKKRYILSSNLLNSLSEIIPQEIPNELIVI